VNDALGMQVVKAFENFPAQQPKLNGLKTLFATLFKFERA
jgi:hypothetical protein